MGASNSIFYNPVYLTSEVTIAWIRYTLIQTVKMIVTVFSIIALTSFLYCTPILLTSFYPNNNTLFKYVKKCIGIV